jgi:NAD(P)-dependent dehydrogenase (short-subunit alcohol dehydrogenase family)
MGTGELRFDGKSVIVTGAARGVGRSHALLLASRGARVVVADLGGSVWGAGSSSEPAELVVKEIEAAGGEAVACGASVAEEAGAAKIVDTAIEAFGRLDAVINNAGIAGAGSFGDLSLDDFRRQVDVHYFGTLYVLKAAWPHLKAAGNARIVNTCSEGSAGIHGMISNYAAAKGGVLGLTLALACEGKEHGILVNGVAPRANTRLSGPEVREVVYGADAAQDMSHLSMYEPDLVSPAAAYLAHESCQLNGVVLAAGAGRVQRMAVMESPGINIEGLRIEDVAANIDTVTDLTNAFVLAGH